MMHWAKQQMRGLRAIVALFALLFAAGPSLQAAACALDGCGVGCLMQQDGEHSAKPAQDQPAKDSSGCPGQGCLCIAAHCLNAMTAPTGFDVLAPSAALSVFVFSTATPLVSTPLTGPERPPRA
jgi:hypothetical protein